MITGLSAPITFKIMNQSKYALGFWNYKYLSAFCRKPIWFGSVVTREYVFFVRYVISPLIHQSFDRQQTHTMNSEFHTPVEWFMHIMYKTWMVGTHDKHNTN